MTRYVHSMNVMMWSVSSLVCQPTTVQLIDFVDYSTSPLFSMIQGKWYYRAEVVLTDPGTARSTRLTFHLSPLPTSSQTWKHRKNARSPRWECLSTHRNGVGVSVSWNGVRIGVGEYRGGEKKKSAKGRTATVLTFVWRYRKEDIFQFKSMLNESGLSTSWPTA